MIARIALGVAVAVTAALLAACSASPTPAPQKGGILTGVEWQLQKVNGSQAPAGPRPVTATFDAKTVAGFSGVNQYSGPYTATADGGFKAGPLSSTMMAGPPEAMQLESGYLKALQGAATYLVANGTLTLYSGEGAPIVVYSAGTAASAELPGSTWQATSINNGKQAVVSVVSSSTVTADFGSDGKLTGNGGVNTYSATYTTNGEAIKIGPAVSTKMAGPVPLMDQETEYFAALAKATTWKITSGRLELRDSGGALQVQYERAK